MKKILLLAIALLTIAPALTAKDKDKDEEVKIVLVKEENSDNYFYEGVVPVEGVTKEEMFKRAKQWVLANLKTSDNNLQFDEQQFTIVNSSTIVVPPKRKTTLIVDKCLVNFKLLIQFKEGRYKFRFDNLVVYLEQGFVTQTTAYSPQFTKYKNENKYIENELNKALTGLEIGLENQVKGTSTQDDW